MFSSFNAEELVYIVIGKSFFYSVSFKFNAILAEVQHYDKHSCHMGASMWAE